MPPRFAYWTIILDGTPTSFRTKEREEILPLFNQLKAKNPSALLKWFSGGTLWDSPEQARETREREKVRAFREQRSQQAKAEREGGEDPLAEFRLKHGRPADGSDDPSTRGESPHSLRTGPSFPRRDDERPRTKSGWSPGSSSRQGAGHAGPGAPRRGKDWRPGGEHKDPRDKYKLPPGEARKRWKDRNLGPRGPKPSGSFPTGGRGFSLDRPAKPGGDRPWGDRPRGPSSTRGGDDRPLRPAKPFGSKPGGDRPWSDKPRGPSSTRGGDDRSLRPGKPFGSKPGGDRPWDDRPRGPSSTRGGDDRPLRPGKPFGSKPGGPRPFGGGPKGPGGPRPFRGRPGKPGGPRGKR
jgi:23S rRNA pseudouridine2605 synthase